MQDKGKEIKKYKYFLMDLDGTVTNPKEGITKAVAYALKHFDIQVTELDSLCKFIGPPLTEAFQKYYDFSEAQTREAILKYREYYQEQGLYENYLFAGMDKLLQNITRKHGVVLLATSKPEVFAKKIVNHFQIDHYFTFIAGSELDLSRYKKEEVIEYALSKMNIQKNEAVMIGDREHDIIGAKKNGLDCVGVLYGFGDRKELENAGADYIVESVAELETLMESMLGEK